MISHLRRCVYSFTRFVKPIFRNIINPQELLFDTKPLINQLKIENAKLANLQVTSPVSLLDSFKLSRTLLDSVASREYKVSCFDNLNREYSATLNYKKEVHLDVEPVEIPVSAKINLKRHFSIDRGVMNIDEVTLKHNQIALVNLPHQVTSNTLKSYFESISKDIDISLQYCLLGLPASAILTFPSKEDVVKVESLVAANPLEENGRVMVVKTPQNNQRERISNRRVAINGLAQGKNPLQLLTELSQLGRILHFDFPQVLRRNASKHEIYSKYKDCDQLIKIRTQYQNGHSEEEYYPRVKDVPTPSNKVEDFGRRYYEKTQSIEDKYLSRLQYAEQITIYPDSDARVLIENRGYCLVLFSCSEEAQNTFFHLQDKYDVELVKDHEFYYDHKLKQELFRYIDNEAIKKEAAAVKNETDPFVLTEAHSQEMRKDIFTKLDDLAELRSYELENSPYLVNTVSFPGEYETNEESEEDFNQPFNIQDEEFQKVQEQEGEEEEVNQQSVELDEEQQRLRAMFPTSFANQAQIESELMQQLRDEEEEESEPELNYQIDDVEEADPSIVDRILLENINRIKQAKVKRALHGIHYKQESQQVGRTFSELAELEVFGKIIQRKQGTQSKVKHTPKKSIINFDYDPEKEKKARDLNNTMRYDIDAVMEASNEINQENDDNYEKLVDQEQMRVAAYMNRNNGELPDEYKRMLDSNYELFDQEGEAGENQEEDANTPPRAQFSTLRQKGAYRSLTGKERNNQLLAYNRMVKQLIGEYFGEFDEAKFKNTKKTYELPTLNRKEIKFTDNSSFLTEDDLPQVLNFHCDQEAALREFKVYHQLEESLKSMPIGFRDDYLKQYRDIREEAQLLLAELGVVEETFEAPDSPQEVVGELNMFQAKLGERYEIVEGEEDQKFIVKTIKTEPLYPLDELAKLSALDLDPENLNQEERDLLNEINSSVMQGSSIGDVLKQQMSDDQVNELLEAASAECQIPVKVLRTMMNLKKQHIPLIQNDIQNQLRVEKSRMQNEKLSPENVIKPTDNNDYLKKKQKNQFFTSKYRQL